MAFLAFDQITKRFPGVLALDGVSFEVDRGGCHALIGENGPAFAPPTPGRFTSRAK